MSTRRLHVESNDPLATKVEKITRFLGEEFFHPSGIMYSFWFWDPDGKQLLPPDQYLKHTISSELPDLSIAYWRAKLNNIPLE